MRNEKNKAKEYIKKYIYLFLKKLTLFIFKNYI